VPSVISTFTDPSKAVPAGNAPVIEETCAEPATSETSKLDYSTEPNTIQGSVDWVTPTSLVTVVSVPIFHVPF